MLDVRKPGGHHRIPTLLGFVAISVAVFFGVRACQHVPERHPTLAQPTAATAVPTENGEPLLPDPKLSPGKIDPTATADRICQPGYSAEVRHVTAATKRKVFAEYNIDPHSDKFEVDHLISLELSGTNDIENLWPESYTTNKWNAHTKDKLENKLHYMVCHGTISLSTAQYEISHDWIAAYKKYIGDQ